MQMRSIMCVFILTHLLAYSIPVIGQSKVIVDDGIQNALARHIAFNKSKRTSPGYRVQVHFGSQRQKAQDMKVEAESLFPQYPVYMSYQAPNFKVRIGDCKSRGEALQILEHVKRFFEMAYIVKDDIALPKL